MQDQRYRRRYFFLILSTIGCGLLSRTTITPQIIYPYLGDLLYALLIFWIIGFLFPRYSTLKVGIISVLLCYGIEISQLCQADLLNIIRGYRLGGLVLGHGFLWSDLVSYTIGGLLGMWLEVSFRAQLIVKSPV